jgi:asparagine synthase (glutamine-hydrolysing)
MCGIVGFTGAANAALLKRMTDSLRHRGPDGEGFASLPLGGQDVVHFGHRRLVVLDREGGAQPMSGPDGRWCLVYNGEVYNHAALREELAREGVRFRTRSDTEVLLQALARWGRAALPRLDGMFAFAALDTQARRLLLAVDRFGQKPLVWTRLPDGCVAFASELTALRLHPRVASRWDALAICRTLAFDAPPPPQTIVKDVFRLEAGTALELALGSDGRVAEPRAFRWWTPPFGRSDRGAGPPTEAFVSALRESVRRQLVADVPVGVLLSGGIDSTAVAALATGERPITTLSMGFGEGDYDESAFARRTAALLGTRHVEFQLTPAQAIGALDAVVRRLDEPLADAGCLPIWELFRQVRQEVTVAVGGDGGDELLEGYPTFRALELTRRVGLVPRGVLRAGLGLAAGFLPVGEGYYPLAYQARRFRAGLDLPPWCRPAVYTGGCGPQTLQRLLRPEVLAAAGLEEPRELAARLYEPALPAELRAACAGLNPRDVDVWVHLRTFLAGEVLRKVDRMSMAHGLEVRAPMLGDPFAELCLAAPPAARRRGGVGKRPLRLWLAGSPLADVTRRRKQGFAIPVARWLRRDFRALGDRLFLEPVSPLWEWCLPERVAELWRAHRDGRDDARKELWALLSLGLWFESHASERAADAA